MGKKKNLVILGVIAVLIAVLAAAALLMPKSASVSGESEILITVDGKVPEVKPAAPKAAPAAAVKPAAPAAEKPAAEAAAAPKAEAPAEPKE